MNKKDIDKMSPDELNAYISSLPEERPPKWSSAIWLWFIGIMVTIVSIIGITKKFDTTRLSMLGAGIAALAGACYLTYRIITFNHKGG